MAKYEIKKRAFEDCLKSIINFLEIEHWETAGFKEIKSKDDLEAVLLRGMDCLQKNIETWRV